MSAPTPARRVTTPPAPPAAFASLPSPPLAVIAPCSVIGPPVAWSSTSPPAVPGAPATPVVRISVVSALVMAVAAVAVTLPPSVRRFALIASVPAVAVSVSAPPLVPIASAMVRFVVATMLMA